MEKGRALPMASHRLSTNLLYCDIREPPVFLSRLYRRAPAAHESPLVKMCAPAHSPSELDADLSQVLAGFLMAECVSDTIQTESLINDRLQAAGLNAPDHILLLAATSHQHALQACVFDHHQ